MDFLSSTERPLWDAGGGGSVVDEDETPGNATIDNIRQIITEMKMDIHMFWLIFSLASTIIWIIYITFYNSRLIGLVLTKLINRVYFKGDFFRIGSLTFNPLAGKIMFRDLIYVNCDYSIRVQDGYMIFRWWRIYVPKDVSEDLSHSDTRLSVMLNGFEWHIYNRSSLYANMEKVFGLKASMLIPTDTFSAEDEAALREHIRLHEDRDEGGKQGTEMDDGKLERARPEAMEARTWRDLIPVIKVDITSGRFVFGNSIIPTTLSICVEEVRCVYSTKPAASRCDHFMHFIKAKAENTKVILAPSPRYTGLIDEPPRFMGEGFVVMMSNLLELYFYMDEPGLVPDEPVLFTLANGDTVEAAPPVWGIDIKCGKGTDFSYGPWADRQRDHLFKFFYPNDYQQMVATPTPKAGELRQYQSFDVSLCTLSNASIDILFSKNKETSAVHVITGAGSYLEVTLPWVTQTDGFTTKITGQLLHVDATTSLQFRSLAECETLQFNIKVHYPVTWNGDQLWTVNLTGSKATAYIVLNHMDFFKDMIDDWASKQRPDILAFVPYTVKFSILLKEFEIIMTSNEFNWIDCSSANQENHHLAFCGDLFDLSFALPFDDFLPETVPLKFWIHGEGLDLSMFIPEVSTSRSILWGIDQHARILTREGQIRRRADLLANKWRRVCVRSAWMDCWSVPIVALAIQYIYHPIPPLGPDPQADITTPEKEELLLSPMRIPEHRKPATNLNFAEKSKRHSFDPASLAPDRVTVEIEIGSSILYAYGAILRNFIHLKDNIFGVDQQFTDMQTTNTPKPTTTGLLSALGKVVGREEVPSTAVTGKSVSDVNSGAEETSASFDCRLYRTFEVTVALTIHDIQAHVMKNCNDNDPPCPIVLIERLGFEMVCSYTETRLQVLVSPCFLISHDTIIRSNKDRHLRQGHLLLSALQVRGHAMFSNEQRSLDEDTLEYSWMLEVQLGKLSGKITLPQLYHVVTGLETLVLLTIDAENQLKSPRTLRYCHHGTPTHLCAHTKEESRYRCPNSEDIKYRLTRVSVDAVDLYLVESGSAIHAWVSPIRLSTCNLHGQQVKSGVTLLISTILLRSFISSGGQYIQATTATGVNSQTNTYTTNSGKSVKHAGGVHNKPADEEVRDDLSLLFHRDDVVKYKREVDVLLHRKEAKEREETTKRAMECSDSGGGHYKRPVHQSSGEREDIYSTMNNSGSRCGGREMSESNELWLEVGSVSLGSIVVESASALPIPEHHMHLIQHSFLKMHDEKSKRLWFLWTSSTERCGCVGGCSFFGSNRNGKNFFKPSTQDLNDCVNIARYHIHSHPKEYGFGQSLLYEGQLVFHTPPYSIQTVDLPDCYEHTLRTSFKGSTKEFDTNSPILIPKHDQNDESPKSTLRTPSSERAAKISVNTFKDRDRAETMDRKGRRYSYSQIRQPLVLDVPYSRLLDTPSKNKFNCDYDCDINRSTAYATHRPIHDARLQRSLRISPPKTSASDSRLTADFVHDTDNQIKSRSPEMSSSAPHSNQMDEEELSIRSPCNSDATLNGNDLQVQRTISLTSENQSEVFFSADEEMHASQKSDGRRGRGGKKKCASDLGIGQGGPGTRLSSHRSDYEINTPEHRSLPKRPQSTTDVHGVDRKMHGLATPLRKLHASPKPEFRHYKCPLVDSHDSSSDNHSISSSSFISAVSTQEDITLVNLQMQANRPIIDSPLLMASYVHQLGLIKCPNWSHCTLPFGSDAFSTPLFQQNEDGGLVYIGGQLVPHFETDAHWKDIRVVSRSEFAQQVNSTAPRSHPWDPSVIIRSSEMNRKDENEENEFLMSGSESISRDSIVVRFRGTANVIATPLLLEGLQRFIESITPTLSALHPLTIINDLHQKCIGKVEADNVLKRDQSLSYWAQVHSNSKRSTTERNLLGPGGSVLTDLYEESISTQLQGLILLPKLNVTLIQSSVVEEVISFEALDNVHDLSCASVLVVSFDNVAARFHLAKTTKAAMHTVYTQPTAQSGNLKKGGLLRGTTRALLASIGTQSRPDNIPGEPVLIETSEKQLEELVVTLDVGKAHSQLRRLKNDASATQENQTLITSIPLHLCKAMFDVIRCPANENSSEKHFGVGYVMFECGLEGVSMKIVKRSHFEKSENSTNDNAAAADVLSTSVTRSLKENIPLHTPNLSDRSMIQPEMKSTSKIGLKLPVTPKISTNKNAKEAIIINIDAPSTSQPVPPVITSTGDTKSEGAPKTRQDDNGKTSSAFIELRTMWFNFAAPPHVPITRKIDYSRLDWNLLSTASPAITAWMNPSNRLAIRLVAMLRATHHRRTALTASVMADALEVQGVHRNPKSRYSGKLTLLSKTLQDDPSCQLCTIMQRYVQKETVRKIDNLLKSAPQELPPLSVLRQGVIVLSRQWKNTLYNPMLFEHQYKNKLQPMNVTYSMPPEEDFDDNDGDVDTETHPLNGIDHHDCGIGEEETERTTLLGQGVSRPVIKLPDDVYATKFADSIGTSTSSFKSNNFKGKKPRSLKLLLGQSSSTPLPEVVGVPKSTRHVPIFPIISNFGNPAKEYGSLIDGSLPSVYSSSDSVDNPFDSTAAHNPKEDLYAWMAKQQADSTTRGNADRIAVGEESKGTVPGQRDVGAPTLNAYIRDTNRLLDAHLIFEPLLSSLGVMPQQMVNSSNSAEASLENLGTNLSLVGSFDTLRIDIVVSEVCEKRQRTGASGNTKSSKHKPSNGKCNLKIPAETPAFLCERVGVDIEVLKVADGFAEKANPNLLYISRGQLKKFTNTVINVSTSVKYISQQVNMPLLRLLHQISNMYQNVKQAQVDIQSQPGVRGVEEKRLVPANDSSSLASDLNDPTLVESAHEICSSQIDLDERYDKFNEFFPIGHSVSRSKMPTLGPLIPLTPSPNAKNHRPQSFAQKLRSTSKSVKGKLGYTNLSETVTTPIKTSPVNNAYDFGIAAASRKNTMESKHYDDLATTTRPIINNALADSNCRYGQMSMATAKCWKTIYHLLDLYAQMPDTKTVTRKVSMSPETGDNPKSKKANQPGVQTVHIEDEDLHPHSGTPLPPPTTDVANPPLPERTRFMIFGVAKIHRTRLLATLSGLKLEAEITALQSSATWRKKARPVSLESSVTGHVGRAMIVLLEGIAPSQQTVVKVTVGKSQSLYSSVTRRGKDKNSGLLSIGPINIDIPQHPVALHGVMTRSSKQLSSTLQELRVTRTSSRLSKQNEDAESPHHSRDATAGAAKETSQEKTQPKEPTTYTTSSSKPKAQPEHANLLKPIIMQFNIVLQSLSLQAALLPSLHAQYRMDNVTSTGFTGSKAKFVTDLPSQSLSFTTKIQQQSEMNLPAEALIALPPVHVSAEYVPENAPQDTPIDGVVLKQGGYVAARADIGEFERCLTTDLLNHLVFVQKVFMGEVNEILQKVYGGEKPVVPLWLEETADTQETGASIRRILFSLNIRVKRIQLTATTPCSSAVRFETDQLELHLSNRVKNMAERSNTKFFGKAQIDLKISLGQLIKNVIFDEAEAEFQQYAFFNTTIGLRNAFQDELANEDKELVLITLKRPLIYIQPVAVDKAILVWLNYKNAYEYWAEKRANLNKELPGSSQQAVYDKLPFGQLGHHIGTPNLSTLYLQLTVEDMGICLPLNTVPLNNTWCQRTQEFETRGAVVITLENTIISACSSGSLVSKGKFGGLCLRFADDFETSLDDWKPNMSDVSIMNLCVVSEGTYEVCSRTIAAKQTDNAKWFLNVKWQMEGVDIHLDVNIGKQLSALGHTLTMLSGMDEDDDPLTIDSPDSEDGDLEGGVLEFNSKTKRRFLESVPSFVFDTSLEPKKRSLMMEKEMSEQLKIISDLRTLGATQNTIAQEERRLQELQAITYKYFRKEMIQKWKRPSQRKAMLKPSNRSQSFIISSPTRQSVKSDQTDVGGLVEDEGNSQESSPQSGPSRSASLRMPQNHRVTFNETMRQSSLPSTDTDHVFGHEPESWEMYGESEMNILDIDGEQVELRKKSPSHQAKAQEPNIDFELDIKVLVNSGKCVLHTKDIDDKTFNQSTSVKQHRRERSIGNDFGSPGPSRRVKEKPRIRLNNMLLTELTIFHIPGLDVKLHYDSKTLLDEQSPRMSACEGGLGGLGLNRRQGLKRASLFACVTLQSIPEETIISPHILEFLEQTLEPIPSKFLATPSNPVNIELLQRNYVTYASFPVDVIVYFHMQPSTFRFSCLPVSRVECMLKLPSLDIVFSSKRHEEILNDFSDGMTVSGGGLSVTGCLADFNVYIFHPYGGKKTNLKENRFAPLADSERKDSLSVNVEFVKFHITRSRTLNYESLAKKSDQRAMIRFSTIVDIGSASFKYDMRRLTEILAFPKAWYRQSIVRRLFLGDLNIHQASTADLDEDLGMRNAARHSRTGSIGKGRGEGEVIGTIGGNGLERSGARSPAQMFRESKSNSLDSTASLPLSEPNKISAWETLVLFAVNFKKLNVQMNMGNVMGNVVWLTRAFQSEGRLSIGSTGYKNMAIGIGLGSSTLDAKGGIVGGTIELSKIKTQFHVREELGFEPSHTIAMNLLALELRLDYMGTSVLMTRISSLNARLRDEWKNSGEHPGQVGPDRPRIILIHSDLSWDQLQMMISKSTTADLLKMYYKLEEFFTQQFNSSKRVFTSLEGRLGVTNIGVGGGGVGSNTNSMNRKQIREQQRRRLISDHGEEQQTPEAVRRLVSDGSHRHWQRPLDEIQGLFLTTLGVPLTRNGTILGGTMELHGQNISLACFHGINFKSKSWALFSLKEPCINFATEAVLVGDTKDVNVIQTLTFGLGLNGANRNGAVGNSVGKGRESSGNSTQNSSSSSYQQAQNLSMANVVRLSRNIVFPPQYKTLHEWFHYTFVNSEIDAVERFPVLEREKDNELNTNSMDRQRGAPNAQPKLQDPNHSREVIFALPSLQLHFKSEHFQRGGQTSEAGVEVEVDGLEGGIDPGKAVVECSFITEFEDHIFVTVDADAFFFLHDLITSYLKEKEKVLANLAVAAVNSNVLVGGVTIQRTGSPSLSQGGKTTQNGGEKDVKGTESRGNSRIGSEKSPAITSVSIQLTTNGAEGGDNATHITKDDVVQAINAKVVADKQTGKNSTDASVDLEAFMRDWREFNCKTWHLEPTVRLLSWAGKSIEPYGIDYILNKLGFSHARTTIPKWLQRGFMDPLDKVQTLLVLQLLSMVREDRKEDGVGHKEKL